MNRFRFPWRSRKDIHRDVDDELCFHLACETDRLCAAGWDRSAAHDEARRRFGDVDRALLSLKAAGRRRENARRRHLMLDEFLADLKYAARNLSRAPGFTFTAVAVLALGIGINSAIFSVVNMMLMRPTMVEHAEQVVGVFSRGGETGQDWRAFSYPAYQDLEQQDDIFSSVAAQTISMAGISSGGAGDAPVTRRVMAGVVSANFFETLGVPLARGRAFTEAEEHPKSDTPVTIVSDAFWRRQGGGDVLGDTVDVNGRTLTIVGVAPPGFSGTTALMTPELWLPIGLYETLASPPGSTGKVDLMDRSTPELLLFARLQPGMDQESATQRLEPLAARLEESFPVAHQNQALVAADLPRLGISSVPGTEDLIAAPVALIMAMGGIVLLIACLNLANMFLARGAGRGVETAIRLSLGGGRLRVLRLLLSEALLLSLLGGVAGLLLAIWGTRALFASLTALIPLGLELTLDTGPDLRVFAATFAFCLVATVLAGLGPAWKQASGDALEGLKVSGSRAVAGSLAPRKWLLIAQIALSLALLTAGGLFLRGAGAAGQMSPGFEVDGLMLAELDTSLAGYSSSQGLDTYLRLLEELRSMPGIRAASASSIVPFGAVTNSSRVEKLGAADPEAAVSAHRYVVADDYFSALGLPILRGRDFTQAELSGESERLVAIIDQPLARNLWPADAEAVQSAVGRTIQMRVQGQTVPVDVIGLVPGTRHQATDEQLSAHVYLPLGQNFAANLHMHLRVEDGLEAAQSSMLAQLRDTIERVDANLPVLGLETMEQHRRESIFLWLVDAGAKVFSALGLMALLLSLVGVYGANAFVTARRTREIGLRMALGATPRTVLAQMLRESLKLIAIGVAAGTVLALGTAQLLRSLIFQVSGEAPLVALVSALLLAVTVLLAAMLPASRATGVEPVEALRQE